MNLKVSEKWKTLHNSSVLSFSKSSKHGNQNFDIWLSRTIKESILILKERDTLIQSSFDQQKKCEIQTSIINNNIDQNFSALDFFEEAIKTPTFIIIVWSPHMAISLHQLRDLKSKSFSVPIIYVVDQNADQKIASQIIEKEKLPKVYLKKWNYVGLLPSSIEHYPSALFVKNGKIVKYVPGYSNAPDLEKLIQENL